MSNAPDLKALREKREEILKAELAAWLHDWQKCIDMAIASHWKKSKYVEQSKIQEWQKRGSQWKPGEFSQVLQTHSVDICHDHIDLKTLAEEGANPKTKGLNSPHYLSRTLARSHGIGHVEKELKENENLDLSTDYLASPLGNEPHNPTGFLQKLIEKVKPKLEKRLRGKLGHRSFLDILHNLFKYAWGDTRRPINEVTLWDWSSIVAALYKAEIVRCVLKGEQREPNQIKWRLLSIRTNGLEYLLSANSIPDLLARKELLTDAWNRVQTLLEEEYPLGLEVYRDENGPVFVVPDIDYLLGLTDSTRNHKTLREFILEAFRQGTVKNDPCLAVAGEIVPYLNPDKEGWDGQNKLPPIGKVHLKKIPRIKREPHWLAEQWCNLPKPEEVCTVCGLRPQGPSEKAQDRKMCDVCEKRRADRTREWATNIGRVFLSTIWLDEVADKNGRLALIVGTFGLDHWLDGTLVRSLAVRSPKNVSDKTKTEEIAKTPSFARLRRIWETTRRFWEETLKGIKNNLAERPRLFLRGSVQDGSLGPYHAYELEIQGRKVAVLWVPPDAKDDDGNDLPYRGGFWVIENLEYLDKVYGRSFHEIVKSLADRKESLTIYEPTEYGRPGESRATFVVEEPPHVENAYLPLIPILAEPRTFMALVPSEKALEILKAIKTKYEREMGKVCNRLPLHLGAVFAGRKMPLRAIMDAGRRMLRQQTKPLIWEAMCSARKQINKGDELPKEFKDDKEGQFKEWYEVTLRNGNHQITWFVPALMGDGQTEDRWYPYVFLASPDKPTGRTRYYKTDLGNPWNSAHPWLVHAGKLQPGDKIYFTPATVDFEFLDYNIRRFEIYYEDGKRKGTLTRPYLLDEFPVLEKIWEYLTEKRNNKTRLSSSQIFAIRNLIETKREEWFEKPEDSLSDENFKRFCKDLFINAQWNWGKPDGGENITFEKLADWAVRGWFTDAVYLFHHVMKEPDKE